MIERATDATFINGILNHPEVRPWVADLGEGELDISVAVAKPENVCLVGEFGAFFCFKYFDGSYEVHTQILSQGRGEWARQFAEAGAHYMFTATDCVEILTRVPEGHVAAAALTQAMGFRLQFVTPPECLFRGKKVPCSIYVLTLQDWSVRATWLTQRGAAFHAWLNAQISAGEPHPDDPEHNRIVGIALDMIAAGRAAKGVIFYNRWAFAARHLPIALLRLAPPQIRFDAGVLTMEGGTIRLEQCH